MTNQHLAFVVQHPVLDRNGARYAVGLLLGAAEREENREVSLAAKSASVPRTQL